MDRRDFIATSAAALLGAAVLPAAAQAAPEMAEAIPTMPFWRLAAGAVNPAHTVTATGGVPTWTALHCACEALETKNNVKAIVVHPDMLKHMDGFTKVFNEGEMQTMIMSGRLHQEVKHDHKILPDGKIEFGDFEYGPVINTEQRSMQLIVDHGAKKDTILLLAAMDKFTKPNPENPDTFIFDENGMAKVIVSELFPYDIEVDVTKSDIEVAHE